MAAAREIHTAGELAMHIAVLPGFVVRLAQADESPVPNAAELFVQPATLQEVLSSHEEGVESVKAILPRLTTPA